MSTPATIFAMTPEESILAFQQCQKSFRPSKGDLLSDNLDPAEECHMKLEPDDEKSLELKKEKREKDSRKHRRQGSDVTAATEQMSDADFSFLDECFDVPLKTQRQMSDVSERMADDGFLEDDCSFLDDCFAIVQMFPCSDEEDLQMD